MAPAVQPKGSGIVTVSPPGIDLLIRQPNLEPNRLLTSLRPGRRFEQVRFSNYMPNPAFPSQAEGRQRLEQFIQHLNRPEVPSLLSRLFRRARPEGRGLYLDGGFGVGKTHLLVSAYFAVLGDGAPAHPELPQPVKLAGFQELMSIIGVLGMPRAIQAFAEVKLLCIDEFELDDPGNTHLANTFLGEIMTRGTHVLATSNTPPGALGEGRFNAARFQEQIRALTTHFEALRIDGTDFRQQGYPSRDLLSPREYQTWATRQDPNTLAQLGSEELQHLLLAVHPAALSSLLEGVEALGVVNLTPMTHPKKALRENTAIRFVHFIDRVYELGLRVGLTGVSLDDLFHESYRERGYAKKYARCLSRLAEMTSETRRSLHT